MNARINLLPHRAESRKRARQHFITVAVGTFGVGAALAFLVYQYYGRLIDVQNGRNSYITAQIKGLEKEIQEINELRSQIDALLARKRIIETLQADRAQTVHLLEQMVHRMPEGVYLKSLRQTGQRIHIVGYAQASARVSTLMRNVDASRWLEKPELVEVKATSVDKKRVSEFNMYVTLKRAAAKDPAKDAKPAAAPAPK